MKPIASKDALITASTYQSFADIGPDGDDQDPHVLVHVLPPESTSRGFGSWQSYIQDLDFFFTRVYRYHQRAGFKCIIVDQLLGIAQFVFVIFFSLFLLHAVNYDKLFRNLPEEEERKKIRLDEVILSREQMKPLQPFEIFILIFASIYLFIRSLRVIHSIIINHAIKGFFLEALKIHDCTAFTWQDVQTRLIQAQHLCLIQESQLNELDVHNRILRNTNYLVALMNKGLLPVHYRIPLIGSVTYLTPGILFNLNYLLFKGPFSFFETSWKLKSELKNPGNRISAARQFAMRCYIIALINFLLIPFIFLWQILNLFFTYAEVIKRDPSLVFGSRNWSAYARISCRHFNELDHQLEDRFNRGYKSASKYMNSFTSPFMEIIAKHVAFVASSILAVLICLTIYDEDVITVEHVITIITGLGAVVAVSRAFMSDTIPQKYSQSDLYTQVLEHLHYIPYGYAPYSLQARNLMSILFQYRITTLIESLLSPLLTPIILAFCLPSRALQIVDFFRNFTIEVQGTGDVCVFALMNIKDHGNTAWRPFADGEAKPDTVNIKVPDSGAVIHERTAQHPVPENLLRTEDGKLELSLIHFKLTNPKWTPNEPTQEKFIEYVTKGAAKDRIGDVVKEEQTDSMHSSQGRVQPQPTTSSVMMPPPSLPPIPDVDDWQENELLSLSRERSRIVNSLASDPYASRMDSNLQMTLSTLFLHEYVAAHPSLQHQQQQPPS